MPARHRLAGAQRRLKPLAARRPAIGVRRLDRTSLALAADLEAGALVALPPGIVHDVQYLLERGAPFKAERAGDGGGSLFPGPTIKDLVTVDRHSATVGSGGLKPSRGGCTK